MSHYYLANIRLFQLSEELYHEILLDQCQGTMMASDFVGSRFRKKQGLTRLGQGQIWQTGPVPLFQLGAGQPEHWGSSIPGPQAPCWWWGWPWPNQDISPSVGSGSSCWGKSESDHFKSKIFLFFFFFLSRQIFSQSNILNYQNVWIFYHTHPCHMTKKKKKKEKTHPFILIS